MDPHPEYDRITEVVRSVQAPAALRERISAERERTLVRRMVVKRMKLAGALSAAAAVLGIAVGLLSIAGGDEPTAIAAAEFASLAPEAPAPAADPADPRRLRVRVGAVSFPTWARTSWRASGERSDDIEGRATRTVFYDNPDGVRLGYTIVEGEALPWPEGAATRGDVRVLRRDGRVLAFWRVEGQSCIISAPASVGVDGVVALANY